MNPEVIAKLLEAVALSQRHADKTLHLAGQANDPATWQAWYGVNHPASYIKSVDPGDDDGITVATITTLNHEADTRYLHRAAKRALIGANETLAMATQVRELIAEFNAEAEYLAGDLKASGARADGLYTALKLIAQAYGIEVDR